MSTKLLSRLRIVDAIEAESAHTQSILPDQPGLQEIANQKNILEPWIKGQLLAGLRGTPQVVVPARKQRHGIRPAPLLDLGDRVVYRALVDFILRNFPPLDRTGEAYKLFVTAPLQEAVENATQLQTFFQLFESSYKYVVKTDVTAFYQYVDHGILQQELLTQTGDHEAITLLVELLAEITGRTYGLPQLSAASDRLSDIYIDIVERRMLKRGFHVWRYNDDFRISVENYGTALTAVESIAEEFHEIGLTMSEIKTTTPSFETYLIGNLGLTVDQDVPENLSIEDDLLGDYSEGVGTVDQNWAAATINSLKVDKPTESDLEDESWIDLRDTPDKDLRKIRRALAMLGNVADPMAIGYARVIMEFSPALTPNVCKYLTLLNSTHHNETTSALANIVSQLELGVWQTVWIIRTISDTGAMIADPRVGDAASIHSWVQQSLMSRESPVVSGEACLALSSISEVGFDFLTAELKSGPAAMRPHYLIAIARLHKNDIIDNATRDAVKNDGGLFKVLLAEQV
ncbi:RNA-directed DNA polymerase [Rhodococcus fascians]|nr:RNA-directed DNA polymerase [Rhodococcus fascians]MBY4240031.1 RNA-directed DNA polymerase [Rhodococcus fascians]MBY4255635.1 RNA-directed DNA polymerase [Rhodococcus fascians]MBY4271496.1 RNA-directed DNA polymerase [Rhodococcus fascians]